MKPETIKSKNDWNMKKLTQSKQINAQIPQSKPENNVGNKFNVNNRHQNDVIYFVLLSLFHVVFLYFTRYYKVSIVDFDQENVC